MSVKQGDLLTYTLTVSNVGPNQARNVVVNDTLSSGTTFVSAHANKGHLVAPPAGETGVVTWNLGDIANETSENTTLVVTVTIRGKTTITNVASASADSPDPNIANNTSSIVTSVASGTSKGK